MGDGGVGQNLKGLLRVDADVREEEQKQDEDAGEDDGVVRRAEARVKASEPRGDEVVPAGGHRETGDSGEDEAGGGDEAKLHEAGSPP